MIAELLAAIAAIAAPTSFMCMFLAAYNQDEKRGNGR
jgi:hypothetical protein